MDGFHDLGGRKGFGPVSIDGNQAPFKQSWEKVASAFMGILVGNKVFNMDEYRHAVERMEARHYIGASYFERTFVAVATLCLEKGVITKNEFEKAVGNAISLARPAAAGRIVDFELDDIQVGDRVEVRYDTVAGHIRLPAYVRGKKGIVVSVSKPQTFADAHGHALEDAHQRVFDVKFASRDLWPQDSDDSEVHVGIFHSYLLRTKSDSASGQHE